MDWRDYIEHRHDVMCGKPVIKGTRLTVEFILERLSEGDSEADLVCSHPRLRPEHIRAALAFGAASLAAEENVFAETDTP